MPLRYGSAPQLLKVKVSLETIKVGSVAGEERACSGCTLLHTFEHVCSGSFVTRDVHGGNS